MEKVAAEVDKLCREKLLAYNNIIAILQQEKEGLRDMNMDMLWEFSRKKNENIAQIEALRSRIIETLRTSGMDTGAMASPFRLSEVLPLFPGKAAAGLQATIRLLERAKNEVQATGTANQQFIKEYLNAFDEIIGVFTARNRNHTYGQNRHYHQSGYGSSMLLHREA